MKPTRTLLALAFLFTISSSMLFAEDTQVVPRHERRERTETRAPHARMMHQRDKGPRFAEKKRMRNERCERIGRNHEHGRRDRDRENRFRPEPEVG